MWKWNPEFQLFRFVPFLPLKQIKQNHAVLFYEVKLIPYTTHNVHMNSYRTTEWASNHSMIEFKFVYGWMKLKAHIAFTFSIFFQIKYIYMYI